MEIEKQELWMLLVEKAEEKDKEGTRDFLIAVKKVCEYGITLSLTIRDTFPAYTLHNETHIRNVMKIMLKLLRERKADLHMEECAMLMMAACCHDIGMSVDRKEKEYLQSCPDCMKEYLEKNPKDYTTAYAKGVSADPQITDEILQHYVRANHHNRVLQQLQKMENGWPSALGGYISAEQLAEVCQSHGENPETINALSTFAPELDLHLCAVLLRLGDILDFDATRAPDALYRYINLGELDGMEAEKSREEWKKHKSSLGFQFSEEEPYALFYRATCTCIQIEQAVINYLDWVDDELACCGRLVRNMGKNWNNLLLSSKIERHISRTGYLSGQYRITLDQEKIIDLLIGRDLYSDPAIFVRELLQNAIDAVRTRKLLDKNLPRAWKPQINIHTWIDEDGYDWFRIEDNGIGMSEETIRNYFLKVGHSYYTSDQFSADKLRCEADPDYAPISRFGIGILSCFMGDPKNNRVEVTTKHFTDHGKHYPAYRMSIQGINGFYYLASDEMHREAAPKMPDSQKNELRFRSEPGTVIAVRTSLYGSGGTNSFKDILNKYIVYPEVPIHYEGIEGSCDYKTEAEFMEEVHRLCIRSKDGTYLPIERMTVPEEEMINVQREYPELIWKEKPNIALYCLPLDNFIETPYVKGAIFVAKAEGEGSWETGKVDEKYCPEISLQISKSRGDNFCLDLGFTHKSEYLNSQMEENVRQLIAEKMQKINTPEDAAQIDNLEMLLSRGDLTDNQAKLIRTYQILESSEISLYVNQKGTGSWFEEYFSSITPEFNKSNYVCHNGVLITHTSGADIEPRDMRSTYLLLKDRYCPKVDISRNEILSLPLEVRCILEAVDSQTNGVFKEGCLNFQNHYLVKIGSIGSTLRDYWQVLTRLPFLETSIKFPTAFGDMPLFELKQYVERQESVFTYWDRLPPFHRAVLLKEFTLKADFIDEGGYQERIIYIEKKQTCLYEESHLELPPGLFLHPIKPTAKKLALIHEGIVGKLVYNAEHPFSIWLLKNQKVLQRDFTGLYNMMIAALSSSLFDRAVESLNFSLAKLRHSPQFPMEVPDDLSLDKDF